MNNQDKFNQIFDDVLSIATVEEIRLVCHINGRSIESLEYIIHARVGYSTYDQWVEMEGIEAVQTHLY